MKYESPIVEIFDFNNESIFSSSILSPGSSPEIQSEPSFYPGQ